MTSPKRPVPELQMSYTGHRLLRIPAAASALAIFLFVVRFYWQPTWIQQRHDFLQQFAAIDRVARDHPGLTTQLAGKYFVPRHERSVGSKVVMWIFDEQEVEVVRLTFIDDNNRPDRFLQDDVN